MRRLYSWPETRPGLGFLCFAHMNAAIKSCYENVSGRVCKLLLGDPKIEDSEPTKIAASCARFPGHSGLRDIRRVLRNTKRLTSRGYHPRPVESRYPDQVLSAH
jgi:hypothetical protein